MKYFLWLIFLLIIGEIIYLLFFKKSEKPEKLTKKQKDSLRKKSGRLKWW